MDVSRVRELARQVAADRVTRLCEVGTTSKGRIVGELVGEPSQAERQWDALLAENTRPHSVECPGWLS